MKLSANLSANLPSKQTFMKIDYQNNDSNPQKLYEEDPFISDEPTFKEKFNHFKMRFRNSHILMRYFLTLYDRQYEKELTQNCKHMRDHAESMIFWSSVGGRVFGLTYMIRKMSIFSRRRFTPIKDLGVFILGSATIYFFDSFPIACYWPYFEDEFIRRDDEQEFTRDPYSSANLDKFRLWYYQHIY